MRLFNWISLALAGTGLSYGVTRTRTSTRTSGRRYMAAQTRATTYTYNSMATGINGVFTECTLDNLQVICTCDTAVEIEEVVIEEQKPAPIIYIVAIVNDDGIGALYTHVNSFYTKMNELTANMEVRPDFRLVHRGVGEGLTKPSTMTRAQTPVNKSYSCEDDGKKQNGYIVTNVESCIDRHGSFDECFHRKVPDSANVICVGNAYHAMYSDLAEESGRVALQFSVHPFSNQNDARFHDDAVYNFTKPDDMSYTQLLAECNKDNLFTDSALIITDAEFNYGNWKDSFSKTNRKAWSELNKCALSNAQDAPGKYAGLPAACNNYLRGGQPENALTNVKLRKECPMIPDFGKSRTSTKLPILIAEQFYATLQ